MRSWAFREERDLTSDENRGIAIRRLEALRNTLTTAPNTAELIPLIDECEALMSAVQTFHMEVTRFRMYNLWRQLTNHGQRVPAAVNALFDEERAALEAAGFPTK